MATPTGQTFETLRKDFFFKVQEFRAILGNNIARPFLFV